MYVGIVLLVFGLACVREECQLVKNFDTNVYMEESLRAHVVSSGHKPLQFLGVCFQLCLILLCFYRLSISRLHK